MLVRPTPAPVAAVYLWIEAGAADEAPGEEGAAHLLEHMLFKGTATRGVGESAAAVETLGGDLNAFTSHDETVVHATVDRDGWAEALGVIADMILAPTIDAGELDREKLVVLEEIRGYADDPDDVLDEAALAALFGDHPYGRPVTGTLATVARLGRAELAAFRARAHGADRAILSVAGDVDPAQVIAEAQRWFGGWGPAGAPRFAALPAAAAAKRALRLDREFDTPLVQLAWRGPSVGHADVPALDVLSVALGEGASALLVDRLDTTAGIAWDVWGNVASHRLGGQLGFGFTPKPGKAADAVEAALDEVAAATRRSLPASVVDRAKASVDADFLFGAETVDGLAHDAAWYLARYGDPLAETRYRDAVRAVEPAHLREAARRWLRPEDAFVRVLDRDPKVVRKLERRAAPAVAAGPRRDGATATLANGTRIVVVPDDTPVVALQAVGLGGQLAEVPKTAGTAAAWARMVTSGAGDLDGTAYGEQMDAIAAEIDAPVGRSTIGLTATMPARWLAEGLDLFTLALTDPRFDDEEWRRIAEELDEARRTRADRPDEILDDAIWAALYPEHPWALPSLGTPATAKGIGPKRLRAYHDALVTGPNLVIAVAGGVDPDEVIDRLGDGLADLPNRVAALGPRPITPTFPKAPVRASANGTQAQLAWVTRGPRLDDPDRVALSVAQAWLDAQGGPLFRALREERALAYGVWATCVSAVDGGFFGIGLTTDKARLEGAREALAAEWARLAAGPTPEETARYRRMVAGQLSMARQRASGRASAAAWGLRFDRPWDLDALRAEVATIDADRVRAALARVLDRGGVEVVVSP